MSALDFVAQAREIVSRWHDKPGALDLSGDIEHALRDAYARGHADGMEDSAKLCDQVEDEQRADFNVQASNGAAYCGTRIRALARLPGGREGE